MNRQPFTANGFKELQLELYQLPDVELQDQADQISADFIAWMISNFTLSANQVVFLSEIEANDLSFLTAQTSFAIVNRLPVKLKKPIAVTAEEKQKGKMVRSESSLSSSSSSDGSSSPTGTLTIQIKYLKI